MTYVRECCLLLNFTVCFEEASVAIAEDGLKNVY